MAQKHKTKSALTIAEKLEHVLVQDWEQPYKIPDNWCWVTGKAVFCKMETRKPEDDFFYYIDIDAIDNKTQTIVSPKYLSKKDAPSRANRAVHDGDTLFSLVRPYLKNIAYVDESLKNCIASTGFFVCTPTKVIIPRYMYWLMTSPYVVDGLNQYMKGDNSPSIKKGDIECFLYPIPPLVEQERIVNRIESLFAKLDDVKEKAQKLFDSFESRKSAIYHKAFSGELTKKWRTKNGLTLNSWKQHKFHELCNDIVRGGSPRPAGSPEFYDGPIPFMKVADITRNDGPYVTSTEYSIKEAGLKKTRLVNANTLLLTNSGATLGVPAICTFSTTFNDGIAAFLGLPEKTLLFYYYFWNSKTQELRAINKGAAQPNLNTKIIGDVDINVPTDKEKLEIVSILSYLLDKETQVKETVEKVLEQIELIKKSILSKAFRGELGTNDPSDENATKLLKDILGVETEITYKKKPVSIPEGLVKLLDSEMGKGIIKLFFNKEIEEVSMDEIMTISSDKFGIIETLRNLEQKKILEKMNNGYYRLMR